jgi:hypothetical protein
MKRGGTFRCGIAAGVPLLALLVATGCHRKVAGEARVVDAGPAGAPVPAQSGPLRFVVVGDTGTGDAAQQLVADAIARKCSADGCDFVQLLGDNIYENGADSVDDPQFQTKFERPYHAVTAPFWIVLGNHDYGGRGSGTEPAKADVEVAYSAHSARWHLPARYWHRTEKNVELLGLDTNGELFHFDPDQRADVHGWMAATTARWRIGFGHHPYHSNGGHGNAGSYDGWPGSLPPSGSRLRTLFDEELCGRLDVYFSGHDHAQEWLADGCHGTTLIVTGAGAKTSALGGEWPVRWQSDHLGFTYVVVTDGQIDVQMIAPSGDVTYQGVVAHR